ncbi:sensor histidine kinase [Ruania zhangjianzhongii]|uniref:sensor histidine kinase n=1 Tax=Ruania zhangjianzhongii TaxID=2603206 RepID=UPI0011C6E9F0|nr:sensor histidine kinase [Ruania zhangjianzhongii]
MSRSAPVRLRGWAGGSDPERFEAYNRWSLLGLLAMGPVAQIVLGLGVPAPPAGIVASVAAWGYVLVSLVQLVAAGFFFARGLDAYLGRGQWRGRYLGVLVAATSVLVLLALGNAWFVPGTSVWMVVLPAGTALASLASVLTIRQLLLGTGAVLLLGAVTLAIAEDVRASGPGLAAAAVVLVTVVCSFRGSVWMTGVVWEQERRREVDARLAVAEERLRFSRDLHDIFGRTLSTVAVRSELAAELARRSDPRGAQTMLEVRQIAQDALKEVRGVVEGYRRVDLATELVGAQDILRAAGVRTSVTSPEAEVPTPAAEALGWVVREAVTNVVRHADATTCQITVTLTDDLVGVQVRNDGVRPAGPSSSTGSGLTGVTERLAALGGTLHSRSDAGEFTVTAQVPRSPRSSR